MPTVKDPKIAILWQNDDMGNDYVSGFKEVISAAIVAESTYEAAGPTIDSQILQLKNVGANAFCNATMPKFAAQGIKKAAEVGWKPVHYLMDVSAWVGAIIRPAGPAVRASADQVSVCIQNGTSPHTVIRCMTRDSAG